MVLDHTSLVVVPAGRVHCDGDGPVASDQPHQQVFMALVADRAVASDRCYSYNTYSLSRIWKKMTRRVNFVKAIFQFDNNSNMLK